MLNYQAKHQTQVGLKFLREVLPKLVFLPSGILSVQKRHQGLKIKRWDFRRSYKSLKTAVVIRPDWQNFFTVSFHIASAALSPCFLMNAAIAAGYGTHNGGLLYADVLTPIIFRIHLSSCLVLQYK